MTREPLTAHQYLDGCPSIWPWLPECIHYNGPGKHEELVQTAIEDVRLGGKDHIVQLGRLMDAHHERFPDSERHKSPISERNSYVANISGWRDEEDEAIYMADHMIRTFGEEKAREIAEEQKRLKRASLASAFLESHNYNPLDVFEEGKEVKPYLPEIPDVTVETLIQLLRGCCDVWTRQHESWGDDVFSDTVLAGCEDALVIVGQHFLGGTIIKEERYYSDEDAEYDRQQESGEVSDDEEEEDDDGYDYQAWTSDYYFLQVGDQRIDLANAYDEFRKWCTGPLKSETVVSLDEMRGDAYRLSSVAVIMRRLAGKLKQQEV